MQTVVDLVSFLWCCELCLLPNAFNRWFIVGCSEAIATKQAQVEKLYASLEELAGDRRLKLDEVLKLYLLNRDIEDLEQWIAEREVVAGSHELGQDFEHVTVTSSFYCDCNG